MTITVAEAQTKLAQIIAQAEAGVDVFLGVDANHPAVNLVPVAAVRTRLTRHPDLVGSTTTHDPAALVQPLPPGEWGDPADCFILATAKVLGGRILSPDSMLPKYPGIITEW